MQLFLPYPDDSTMCARSLDDARLNKQILELAQCLSTVVRHYLMDHADPRDIYKATHANHPIIKWLISDYANVKWACDTYYPALVEERRYRYGRDGWHHKSFDVINRCWNRYLGTPAIRRRFPEHSPFVRAWCNCTPDNTRDVGGDYRRLLREKWNQDKRAPHWTHRGPPLWIMPDTFCEAWITLQQSLNDLERTILNSTPIGALKMSGLSMDIADTTALLRKAKQRIDK